MCPAGNWEGIILERSIISLNLVLKPVSFGILAALVLFVIYFLTLTLLNSATHAWDQFLYLGNWMIPLIIGFGIQVGLFQYMRGIKVVSSTHLTGKGTVAATAGVSTASMVACCLHHITDVLPLIGMSAVAGFLGSYQELFLAIGVASNIIGIAYIFRIMQKHELFYKGGVAIAKLLSITGTKIFFVISIFFAIVVVTIAGINTF